MERHYGKVGLAVTGGPSERRARNDSLENPASLAFPYNLLSRLHVVNVARSVHAGPKRTCPC